MATSCGHLRACQREVLRLSQNPSVVDAEGWGCLTCWSCKAADMSVLSETPEPFTLMAGHLRGVAEAYQLLLQLESAPGSLAQQESFGEKYAGFGASRPELEAGLLPLMLLGQTCDHAHALAATLEAPGAIISPLSLVRPALSRQRKPSTSLRHRRCPGASNGG